MREERKVIFEFTVSATTALWATVWIVVLGLAYCGGRG